MIVTKVEPLSKTKYKIYLNHQFAFVLYKGELRSYKISDGRELSVRKNWMRSEKRSCLNVQKREPCICWRIWTEVRRD